MKILIVEDDNDLREITTRSLEKERYVVSQAPDYMTALRKIEDYDYDCILLDIMLPDGNGLDLLGELRALGKRTNVIILPDGNGLDLLGELRALGKRTNVIILSAKDSLEDKVKGLDLGADDYLPKPYHLAELHARLKSLFRRNTREGEHTIRYGNIELVPDLFKVLIGGKEVELNRKEYDILSYFMLRPGRLVNKNTLAESVWGDHIDQVDNFDFIYAQIKNLRRHLKEAGATPELKAVYGIGYKFVIE